MSRPDGSVLAETEALFTQGLRRCRKCMEIKSSLEFGKNKCHPNGLQTRCKTCVNRENKKSTDRLKAKDYEGFQSSRRKLRRDWAARQKQEDPEQHAARLREDGLKNRYGLTQHQFNVMLAEQDGRCAICMVLSPKAWHVDHDHKCCAGRKSCGQCIRGILCDKCNIAIGGFDDDGERLMQGSIYLRKAA